MTKLSRLKIDPEFQNQINPPSFEETHQLEMNILKEERVLNPIITWNGYIVDGHTRYQILRKYPFIPFEVIEKEFSSRYEALVWICKNQLGRRNLTPEQKKFLIGKQAEAEKQIKSFHGNQYTLASESGLVQNEPDRTKHGSRSKVAAEHGTSESYVYRAEPAAFKTGHHHTADHGSRRNLQIRFRPVLSASSGFRSAVSGYQCT